MKKIIGLHKKVLAFSAALLLILSMATNAFADESEGIGLSEAPEENAEEFVAPVDFSELEHQISIVNGLYENDYTRETWKALKEVFEEGKELLGSEADQETVTTAARNIKTAIGNLVRVDYSKLEKALNSVYAAKDQYPEYHDIWDRINTAVEESRPMLVNGDQHMVDSAAAKIESLLAELEGISFVTETEPEIIIKEVQVEVPPSDDFCNIASHRAWPVLFTISFVLNLAFLGMGGYVFYKKRRTSDDIPLVNYDIDDDMDFIDDMDDFVEEIEEDEIPEEEEISDEDDD